MFIASPFYNFIVCFIVTRLVNYIVIAFVVCSFSEFWIFISIVDEDCVVRNVCSVTVCILRLIGSLDS